jgi:hypothetical protein
MESTPCLIQARNQSPSASFSATTTTIADIAWIAKALAFWPNMGSLFTAVSGKRYGLQVVAVGIHTIAQRL